MSSRKINILKELDWTTVILFLVLLFMGWISVYGASYDFDHPGIFDFSQRAGKQLVWIVCSIFLGAVLLMIDSRIYEIFAYYIFAIALMLLIATIFLAHDIKGSRSWLVLGPISIQSAEFAKFATALAIARCMSSYNFKLKGLGSYIPILAFIFVPVILILLQKETGLALVFLAFFLMLYREGMPGVFLYLALCFVLLFIFTTKFDIEPVQGDVIFSGLFLAQLFIIISSLGFIIVFEKKLKEFRFLLIFVIVTVLIGIILAYLFGISCTNVIFIGLSLFVGYLFWLSIKHKRKNFAFIAIFIVTMTGYSFSCNYIFEKVLEPHQQMRIKVALGMENDLQKAGYNVNQSKIAIGSGQFSGKGFLNGTQTKLKYVPEQDTDFIFCTVGEEYGFVGSVTVIGLFLWFMLRLLKLAERQRDNFSRIYGYCVVSIFFFHFAINIGMILGLSPVIGIPLPFFSYGGSSLFGFTFLLFIFLRLDVARLERMY